MKPSEKLAELLAHTVERAARMLAGVSNRRPERPDGGQLVAIPGQSTIGRGLVASAGGQDLHDLFRGS